MMTTHRLGKIARLPYGIRSQLNARLADNEPAADLVDWLNAQPEVQAILAGQFDGRPITQQNLSAWKQGGFRDWERFQESSLEARTFLEEAGEFLDPGQEDENGQSFLDRLGGRVALTLLQLLRETERRESGPDRTRDLLNIARELIRLQQGEYQRQCAAITQQQRIEKKQQEAQKQQSDVQRQQAEEKRLLSEEVKRLRTEFLCGLVGKILMPWRARQIRAFFEENAEEIQAHGLARLPKGEELARALEDIRQSQREDGFAVDQRGVPIMKPETDQEQDVNEAPESAEHAAAIAVRRVQLARRWTGR
jgi:hypothetical protein